MPSAEIAANQQRIRIEYGSRSPGHPAMERERVIQDLMRPLPSINSKYFYDDRGSRLFEAITTLPEYYQTRTEESLLKTIAGEVAARTQARQLVELGSGAGRKIRLLLDAMAQGGHLEGCILLDINQTFLLLSAQRLEVEYPGMEVVGWVGDFVQDIGSIGPGPDRLFVFLAGTIGNLNPTDRAGFLRDVSSALGPRDAFLVGLDLVKDVKRLEAAYNDEAGVTATFNRNILRVLNRYFGTDFEVGAFEHVAFYDAQRQWIEMRLRAARPVIVDLGGGRELRIDTGGEIRTEISCKFTRDTFKQSLVGSGLRLSRWFSDPNDLFALALVRPDASDV